MTIRATNFALCVALFLRSFSVALGAPPGVLSATEPFPQGAEVYREHCAVCHDTGAGRAPQRVLLSYMTPAAIHTALTSGVMRAQAAALTEEQKIAVAEQLSGRAFSAKSPAAPLNLCKGDRAKFDFGEPPAFSNWGLDLANTHAVPTASAGIDRMSVGRLRLKWAFGFEGANRARSQPAIAGGAIFVGAQDGSVFALDRDTGCTRWRYRAMAEVRTGIVVSAWRAGDTRAKPLAYFGDWAGNAYAVNAFTGRLVWKVKADAHPAAVITGTPSLYDHTLYVPVSSLEEASAAAASYPCCTFRGSVLALDAATGAVKWRTWLVDEPKVLRNDNGVVRLGPAGVPVWTSPAIDPKRNQLYIATGDGYTAPAAELSDSIVAINLATGKVNWHYQALADDAWNVACLTPAPANCPQGAGPDYDFGAAAMLASAGDGREFVLAGQKGGVLYSLDPDSGRLAWQKRVGRGGMAGGIYFGLSSVDGYVYVPVSDNVADGRPSEFPASPGLYALDIGSGEFLWKAPAPQDCGDNKLCLPGYGGAISATPELVLAGSDDAHLRVFDAANGAILWDFNTDRDFATVNGVVGHGGAISGGAAPLAEGGNLVVPSGYGFVSKMPGNVLLVFGVN